MAKASLENKLQERAAGASTPSTQGTSLKALLNSPAIKKRFDELLDKRSAQYMTSIVNLYNSDAMLQKAEPMSVISSCIVAATLDLPVDKNLGYAWIVPYSGKAQFQLGYKGYIQLALRTGQYKAINVIEVCEGELVKWNPLTEALELDFEKRKSDAVMGYAGYFELINGFRKSVYWTREQIESHRKKFSKSDFGWKKDYDAMAKKTVIRNMLSKWGILSIEMQDAYSKEIEAVPPLNNENEEDPPIDLTPEDYRVGDEPQDGKEQGEMNFE
ncbi:recombinase RecT [Paenibacillus cellulositrophicus]|uniref:recombinase RecT n=1 Tax=Paenibacillus cellulositrophicus TaxID=562959 RepID=UPI003F82363D